MMLASTIYGENNTKGRAVIAALAVMFGIFTMSDAYADSVYIAESCPFGDGADLMIFAGTILDPASGETTGASTIRVKEGRIVSISEGFTDRASLPQDVLDDLCILDVSEKVVMPGFVDVHVHIQTVRDLVNQARNRLNSFVYTKADLALLAQRNAKQVLMAGFTTVRNAGDNTGVMLAIRRAIRRGDIVGPRIQLSGPALGPSGTQGDPSRWGYRPAITEVLEMEQQASVCDGVDACTRNVRRVVGLGSDWIKLKASGGVEIMKPGEPDPEFTQEELNVMVETGHLLGRKVLAHAISGEAIKSALRAGVDSIEHGTEIDKSTIKLFKKSGATLVPTLLAPYDWGQAVIKRDIGRMNFAHAQKVMDTTFASVKLAYQEGVPIALGSDVGYSAHTDGAKEFILLVKAGLSELDAIRAGTVVAADLLGLSQEIGRIEPGFLADMVILPGNPLENIDVVLSLDFVIKEGVVYSTSTER